MSTTSSTSDRLKLESKAELLRFNPTSPVVYERWLRAQYAEAGKLYGIYATIFLTGLRHVPMMPIAPEGYDDMDPHNPNVVLFLKRINTYAQAVELSNTTDQNCLDKCGPTCPRTRSTESLECTQSNTTN